MCLRPAEVKNDIWFETGDQPGDIDLILDLDVPITDQMLADYHQGQRRLVSISFLEFKPAVPNEKNICIVCQWSVADEQIIQHLFDCTGVGADQINYRLSRPQLVSCDEMKC